jgi:hypothetical protein
MELVYHVDKSRDILTQLKNQSVVKESIFADVEKQLRATFIEKQQLAVKNEEDPRKVELYNYYAENSKRLYQSKMDYLKRNLFSVDNIVCDSIAQGAKQVYVSILRCSYMIHIR